MTHPWLGGEAVSSADPAHFKSHFKQLTGFAPLSWQERLYEDHFHLGRLPGGVDIPTGLGKTSIIALWLIARAFGTKIPRRLVYVVDRRAVVDQATEFVQTLRQRLDEPGGVVLRQYKHAIEGFTGPDGGVMPPKGGNPALTEEQMHATVDWMLGNLK